LLEFSWPFPFRLSSRVLRFLCLLSLFLFKSSLLRSSAFSDGGEHSGNWKNNSASCSCSCSCSSCACIGGMVFLSHRSMIGGNWSTLFPLKVRARSSVSSSSSNSRRNRRVIKERLLRRAPPPPPPPPPQQRRPDWDVSTAALSISDLVLLLCFYPRICNLPAPYL
jgi:hypothetical protein